MPAVDHLAPIADHHQHLASWRTVAALNPPRLPAVDLPAELADLFRRRAEDWRDPDVLKEIFTEDAIVLNIRVPGWSTGAEPSAWGVGCIGGGLFRDYALTPVAYRVSGPVAHLWGGAGYQESALAYLSRAVAAEHPAARNLYSEVAQAPLLAQRRPEILAAIAQHMRAIGLERIYYGLDTPLSPGIPPQEHWQRFRTEVPLTAAEMRSLAENVAPWAH